MSFLGFFFAAFFLNGGVGGGGGERNELDLPLRCLAFSSCVVVQVGHRVRWRREVLLLKNEKKIKVHKVNANVKGGNNSKDISKLRYRRQLTQLSVSG